MMTLISLRYAWVLTTGNCWQYGVIILKVEVVSDHNALNPFHFISPLKFHIIIDLAYLILC